MILRVGRVEQLHVARTLLCFCATIETKVLVTHVVHEVGHDVHDLGHLEEDEDLSCTTCSEYGQKSEARNSYSVVGREELGQNTREQLYLARTTDELVIDHRARVDLVLNALEQEGVLADLPELHELIA